MKKWSFALSTYPELRHNSPIAENGPQLSFFAVLNLPPMPKPEQIEISKNKQGKVSSFLLGRGRTIFHLVEIASHIGFVKVIAGIVPLAEKLVECLFIE